MISCFTICIAFAAVSAPTDSETRASHLTDLQASLRTSTYGQLVVQQIAGEFVILSTLVPRALGAANPNLQLGESIRIDASLIPSDFQDRSRGGYANH